LVDNTILSRKFLITFDYCSNPIPLNPPSPFEGEGGRYFRKGTTSLLNSLLLGDSPLKLTFCIFYFVRGRGSVNKRGGEAPSLKLLPPLLLKERGIKGVRLVRIRGIKINHNQTEPF